MLPVSNPPDPYCTWCSIHTTWNEMKVRVYAVSLQELIIDQWMKEWYHKSLPKWNESRCMELAPIVLMLYLPQSWQRGSNGVERLTEEVFAKGAHISGCQLMWTEQKGKLRIEER